MNLPSRCALLFTGAVLAAGLPPIASASAEALVTSDETGDVWESLYDESTQTESFTAAGTVLNTDIVGTRATHTAKKLIITVTFDSLKKQEVHFAHFLTLRFDDAPKVAAYVDAYGPWKGMSALSKEKGGKPIKCADFDHDVDYGADTLTYTIPRSCVGNPKWYEFSEIVLSSNDNDTPGDYSDDRFYKENGLSSGHGNGGWSEKVRKG